MRKFFAAALLCQSLFCQYSFANTNKVIALQAAEISALKAERDKLKMDLTLLWKRTDQLNSRVLKLMEKISLSEADINQPANTISLCQTCIRPK